MSERPLPTIIQGGMGIAVSSWRLAREVSLAGELGVVSGTALDAVLARTLQDGDPGGHYRRALAHFPNPEVAQRILDKYFKPEGRQGAPYRPHETITVNPKQNIIDLCVAANFCETWLAKEGHDGLVGINFLEKVQMATPTAALGAVLAGVDYVLMGAGIPREIPQLLRDLSAGRPGGVHVDVDGGQALWDEVDPTSVLGGPMEPLPTPRFLAIISVHSLANFLNRDEKIKPFGFVVEGPVAGGHSAPPRGRMNLDEQGDPIYGEKDVADLVKMAAVGSPFWMAGAYSEPERVQEALDAGAVGVQCGTIFALAKESGMRDDLRRQMLDDLSRDQLDVRNDPRASPTGFPFKIAQVAGTLSDPEVYQARPRLCDLSYLRQPYQRENGSIGYRCASEPVDAYLKKGGRVEDTVGRKCLCNCLMANIGLGQERKDGYTEDPGITLGQDVTGAKRLLEQHPEGWGAADAVGFLLGKA
ncbi:MULTISPECIES: nitronate monooxygenase [unclassified Luteococcus]|uniref:nitronate monooxygenase n=1 Tax=unclassified Luteococcus TaxID=2639923 RepID=UPI00313E4397